MLNGNTSNTDNTLVSSIAFNSESQTLAVGETVTLQPTVQPSGAVDKSLTYASSDESIATVDSAGVVTAQATGEATITATANDGSNVTQTVTVTVTE